MSAAKRGRHAKRPGRANRASGLAVAVGLGIAVATTGHGIASASTGEGSTSGSPDSDTGSKTTTATDSGASASDSSGTSGETSTETTQSSTSTPTSSGSQSSTTTPSGDGPTSTVSASGGSGTTVSGDNSTSTTPTHTTTEPTAETEKPKPPEKQKSATTEQAEQTAAPAVKTETAETVNATTENAEAKTEAAPSPPAARTMVATTSTTTPVAGLPTVTLPPYPTIPGVSPTRVAVAVVVVLGRALQTALSGPVPNPIAIPIYMVLVAAYQRLTEIALNHVPVVTQPTPALQVPIVGTITGTLVATDPDGDPLTFTYTQPSNGGLVVVTNVPLTNQYTYVYTPPLVGGGGANSFTVTFDDTGVGDHFYAPNGHTTSYTVNLDVPNPVVGAADSIGVVRGGFTGSAAGRTFSLANGNTAGATATSAFTNLGGIVSLNTTTGDWTYVPAVSGHNILGVPTNTDTFVVTVDDGVNGAVQTTVSVGADLGIAVTGASTNPANGAYSGGLNIPVGDNGLLTYSAGSTAPTKGSVFVNGNGGFIYTPTLAARHAAAATNATAADKIDTFTIKGTDANGRSITVATVTVNILSQNNVPTGTATFPSAAANGVISGSVSASDLDSDTLTYSGTAGKGTVVFNGTNFTYTPTLTARHAAAADGASTSTKQDVITITVDDGHGGVATISSGVFNITPQNNAPVYTTVSKSSSGVLGLTKTWTINGTGLPGNVPTDADGDTITYAVTTLPSGGLLNVPVILGNVVTLVSLGTEAGKQFVVTMSDGHGGNVPVTLTI
jgi:large repetitive protein